MSYLSKAVLYVRLPARADAASGEYKTLSIPFAIAMNGRLHREGYARLEALSSLVTQVHQVVMLLSASDVTVLSITPPPLSASRLKTALPALVEESILGDAADCHMVIGPDRQGDRTVCIIDRAWLQQWSNHLLSLGAHRLSAKPIQLCLPLLSNQVTAALIDFTFEKTESRELVVRFSAGEGTGFPLGEKKSDAASASEVLYLLSTLATGRPVELALPEEEFECYHQLLSGAAATATPTGALIAEGTNLRIARWTDWIAHIDACEINLMTDFARNKTWVFDTRRWRAAAVFAIATGVVNIAALNWDWWRLHREGQRLQQEMQRVYSTVFHDAGNAKPIDPAIALADMKKKRMALRRAAGEASADDFLVLSAMLGEAWPSLQQGANISARDIASIEYRNAALELHLKPELQVALDTVRKVLTERGLELGADSSANFWKIRSIR